MLLFLCLTFLLIYIVNFYWKVSKYPRGPLPLPFLGNILQLDPSHMHQSLSKFAKEYGNIYTLWSFGKPKIVISDYEVIREVLVKNAEALSDRTSDPPSSVLMRFDNCGIAFSNDEMWKKQRTTSMHILKDFGLGKNVEALLHNQILQFAENIKYNYDFDGVNFERPIQALVANVINQVLYGFSYPHNDCPLLISNVNNINSILLDISASFWPTLGLRCPFLLWIPYIKYKAVDTFNERMAMFYSQIEKDIETAMEGYSLEEDPMCLVQAYKQQIALNPMLNDVQLVSNCSDLFIGATDPPSATLHWTLIYFAKYPEEQDKIRAEIASVIGLNRLPELSDRLKLPLTQAFILELQRHSNIVAVDIPRNSKKDVSISGHHIPAGTDFLPNIYEALIDPKIFEDPERFNPARFLNDDGVSINQNLASKLIIYGMGRRQCAGESLARSELFIFTVAMIQKFRFFPSVNEPINMDSTFGLTLQPNTNRLRIEEVNQMDYTE